MKNMAIIMTIAALSFACACETSERHEAGEQVSSENVSTSVTPVAVLMESAEARNLMSQGKIPVWDKAQVKTFHLLDTEVLFVPLAGSQYPAYLVSFLETPEGKSGNVLMEVSPASDVSFDSENTVSYTGRVNLYSLTESQDAWKLAEGIDCHNYCDLYKNAICKIFLDHCEGGLTVPWKCDWIGSTFGVLFTPLCIGTSLICYYSCWFAGGY